MKQKLIAAFALAAILVWSVPPVWAIPRVLARVATRPSAAHDHSCCPKSHAMVVPGFDVFAARAVPCGDEHPCCAQQRPQAPSSLPEVRQNLRRDLGVAIETASRANGSGEIVIRGTTGSDSFPHFRLRSTVLRI